MKPENPAVSVDIQWKEIDPATGLKRQVRVTRFAGRWVFEVRSGRHGRWIQLPRPTLEHWETVLEAAERRYTRREGVTEADLQSLKKQIANFRQPPQDDRDWAGHDADQRSIEGDRPPTANQTPIP